jgi:acid phosphatase family membrane protein YuiD
MHTGIILGNKILDVVTVSWFIAQFYKVIASLVTEKKFNLKRMFETGGMPSSHSSTVSALATSVGIIYGVSSALFAVSAIFAIIVMHDASGIRRAAGEQAGILNKLSESLNSLFENKFQQENLRELLGHTRFEVIVGTILGIAVALLMKPYLLG